MKIEFLNCLFFLFSETKQKKPNELENIPLSTVVTQVKYRLLDCFTLTTSEIPTSAHYVALQKYFSHQSLVICFFATHQ
jgi:hypothetical protein